eukprot:Colp12_sorted_trinity150504_noHs@35589
MLAKAVKAHQAKQTARNEELEKQRKEIVASAGAVSHALANNVNSRVSQIFSNEKELEVQARQLSQLADRFVKQTNQWLTLVEDFNQALKEIGDVENWAKTIEVDMAVVASCLRYSVGEDTVEK